MLEQMIINKDGLLDELRRTAVPSHNRPNLDKICENLYLYITTGMDTTAIMKMLKILDIDLEKILYQINPNNFEKPIRKLGEAPFIDYYFKSIHSHMQLKMGILDYIIERTPKEALQKTLLYMIEATPELQFIGQSLSTASIDKLVSALDAKAGVTKTGFNRNENSTYIYSYIKKNASAFSGLNELLSNRHLIDIIHRSPASQGDETILSMCLWYVPVGYFKNKPDVLEAIIGTTPLDDKSLKWAATRALTKGIDGVGILNKIDKRYGTNWAALITLEDFQDIRSQSIIYLFKHKDFKLDNSIREALKRRADYAKLWPELESIMAGKEKWAIFKDLRKTEKEQTQLGSTLELKNGAKSEKAKRKNKI